MNHDLKTILDACAQVQEWFSYAENDSEEIEVYEDEVDEETPTQRDVKGSILQVTSDSVPSVYWHAGPTKPTHGTHRREIKVDDPPIIGTAIYQEVAGDLGKKVVKIWRMESFQTFQSGKEGPRAEEYGAEIVQRDRHDDIETLCKVGNLPELKESFNRLYPQGTNIGCSIEPPFEESKKTRPL